MGPPQTIPNSVSSNVIRYMEGRIWLNVHNVFMCVCGRVLQSAKA